MYRKEKNTINQTYSFLNSKFSNISRSNWLHIAQKPNVESIRKRKMKPTEKFKKIKPKKQDLFE